MTETQIRKIIEDSPAASQPAQLVPLRRALDALPPEEIILTLSEDVPGVPWDAYKAQTDADSPVEWRRSGAPRGTQWDFKNIEEVNRRLPRLYAKTMKRPWWRFW